MAISAFTPAAYAMITGMSGTSQAYALPSTDATIVISNIGPAPAAVLLGGSSVAVTPATGMVVLPNQSIALAVGSNAYIAAMGISGAAQLNLAQGA